MYRLFFKRVMDVAASFAVLAMLSPLWFVLALANAAVLGGSPFFSQERPGRNGVPFHLLKFKTMTDDRDAQGKLLPNHLRITRFGSFLRRSSLDEIPQLWNVLVGDMSLVGPRPLLPKYLPLYSPEQARRHEVRPGITGWAQVNGRNAITWHRKFELDVWYVDHLSFSLDMAILFKTVQKIVVKEGVDRSATVTMPPFDGTN